MNGYHISNLGDFGSYVRQFADIDGYVPGADADLKDFRYPSPNDLDDPAVWAAFVALAVAATSAAEAAAAAWQAGR